MKILSLSSIKGPNYYSYYPVIVMEVDLGEYIDIYTDEIPGFVTTLLGYFPGLNRHHCSKGYAGGFLERLQKGTLLGHVMEHLALELQSLIAKPVHYGKTRYDDQLHGYRLIFSYHNEALGLAAGKLSLEIVEDILQQKKLNLDQIFQRLEKELLRTSYGASTQAIVAAAERRNIPVMHLSKRTSLLQLGYGSKQKRIQATITDQTSCIGVDLACDKLETKELFCQLGIPVARGYLATTFPEALKIMEEVGIPAVVKPIDGNQGQGVSLNITTAEELKKAFEIGQRYSENILIEEYINGNDYRLTVIDGKFCAAAHRLPPFIIGDGKHSIRQLIKKVNSDKLRGDGHEKPLTKIKVDQVVLLTLFRQNLNLESILPQGKKVFLRENGNLSTGGTAYDVSELVHPENRQLVERAASIMGLDVAGIDLRTADISRPISRYGGAIIEVNAAPGIRMHHYPTAGRSCDVADAIVKMLFPQEDGRIPIFAVTGTNGKTTTVRLLHHILLQTGQTVGMTTTDGIYINRQLIYKGDATGPWSSQLLLKDPQVDMAVLELARGGILRGGLGYDQSDVGLVLNVSEDHLGGMGINSLEELANVKSLIVEMVNSRGMCVLNGDNPYTLEMAKNCLGRIVYFTKNPPNRDLENYANSGGIVISANGEMIEIKDSQRIIPVLSVKEIPLTWNGKANHQLENVLGVIASLYSFGIDLELIRNGLRSFAGDIQINPGRLNLIEHNGWRLIIDYGHNFEGYRSIIDFAQEMGYHRLLGVIGLPGDRPDDSMFRVGKLVGQNFNKVWIKEDEDLRGRSSGEVARILRAGICSATDGMNMQIVLDEQEALQLMLDDLGVGDIGVIFYEKNPEKLFKTIEKYIENDYLFNKNRQVLAVNSSR